MGRIRNRKTKHIDKTKLTIDASVYMDTREWMDTIMIKGIPFIGLFVLISWIRDENTKPCKKSWAKAVLVKKAINVGMVVLFVGLIALAMIVWGEFFMENIQPLLDLIEFQKNITGTDFMVNESNIQNIQKLLNLYLIKQ